MRSVRVGALVALCAFAYPAIALAQTAAERQQQEDLRRMLERKYGNPSNPAPATRSMNPPRPGSGPRDDLRVIRPDGSVVRPDGTRAPGQKSDATSGFPSSVASTAVSVGRTIRIGAEAVGAAARREIGIATAEAAGLAPAPGAAPALELVPTQGSDPVVRRDSYVIQLKLGTSSAQIENLLSKYNLTVVRYVASLGLLYVEPRNRSATRSLRAGEKETLQSVLEPRVIVNLRNESIVDSAYVHSSINTKSVPPAADIKAKDESGKKTLRWHWQDGNDDGNWGLKAMRMPAVWTILDRVRKARGQTKPAGIIVLDTGFGPHPQLTFSEVQGKLPAGTINPSCGRSHGTHVAGIAGAAFGQGKGIDGMVPSATLTAIPISRGLFDDAVNDGLDDAADQSATYFLDAIFDLQQYIDDIKERQLLKPGDRRVVNISLAYNWLRISLAGQQVRPTDRAAVRNHVRGHAKTIFRLVNQVRDQVLFVAAAGNDSVGLATPANADLATPFAFASTTKSAEFTPSPKNIVIVEAVDRTGKRAAFSNVGGHVAAPGVDIMSTFASAQTPFGVCDGTSQAAPHVTALAAILMELNPDLSPAQIGDLIRSTANPSAEAGVAPMVDAFAAVLKAVPGAVRLLADLNGDGKVDIEDMTLFKQQLLSIEAARFGAEPYKMDLNGDGVVDRNEACFPRIDLNGSGRVSYDPADKRPIDGVMRSDLDVLELAWTDTAKTFKAALAETGLEELLSAWQETRLVASAAVEGARPPCN